MSSPPYVDFFVEKSCDDEVAMQAKMNSMSVTSFDRMPFH
jgi:hypothetical protein